MLDLPEARRKRQAMYDCFANPAEMLEQVGLTGDSPDNATMERRASIDRLRRCEPFKDVLRDHCQFMAAVFLRVQRGQFEAVHGEGSTSEISEEEWEHTHEQLWQMLMTSAISGITLLVELGALEHPSEAPS